MANIQQVLDTPIYSKVDLDASGSVRFFNVAGPSAAAAIDSANQIDKDARFTVHQIGLNLLRTSAGAIREAQLEIMANVIRFAFLLFQKNGQEKVWQQSVSALLSQPNTTTAAPTVSGYDISASTRGMYRLNQPIVVPGGQTINFTMNWATPLDLSGITAELVLYGILDRTKARGI